MNIYGTIGYSILINKENKQRVLIMADMHNKLPECENRINISKWLDSKKYKSKILLEEVPRDGVDLMELWSEAPHTQELKNFYLKNPSEITAVDPRPFLIPFSWEILLKNPDLNKSNVKFIKYLQLIDDFFSLNHHHFKKYSPFYSEINLKGTNLGNHFLKIKKKFKNYLEENRDLLELSLSVLITNNLYLLEQLNNLLDDIMEWNICGHIVWNLKRSIILHAGLAHSEKIIDWLINQYNFYIKFKQGINKLQQTISSPIYGCINLSSDEDSNF